MTPEHARWRRMLGELRGACMMIAILSFVALAWQAAEVYLLVAIGLVAVHGVVMHAYEPDPGEDVLVLYDVDVADVQETVWVDPKGGRHG